MKILCSSWNGELHIPGVVGPPPVEPNPEKGGSQMKGPFEGLGTGFLSNLRQVVTALTCMAPYL